MPSSTEAPPTGAAAPRTGARRRTLWEEGHHPGPLVVRASAVAVALVATLEILLRGDLGAVFDVAFVVVCTAAALWVRPRDFFVVGVLPPLLLLAVVVTVTVVDRDAIARAGDSAVQAVVSGLAHHAVALTVGYALTLAVLALRQVALRHAGALRPAVARRRSSGS